jgi:ferredoxin
MCEFCTKHGEGKKWYLEMKNYSRELLRTELSSSQKETVRATTRAEWLGRWVENFAIPMVSGVPVPLEQLGAAILPTPELRGPQVSEDEIVEGRKVAHFAQVLPIEDVERVIDMVDSITRLPCGCRFVSTGKSDKRYCFGLGMDTKGLLGKFPAASASLEVLDKEAAKKIIREYDKEGLIHTLWTCVTPYIFGLCNCDHDCLAYRPYIEERGAPSFFRAEYICRVDPDLCSGCKDCMRQCQFGAQFYSSGLGKVYIDPTRCFGCGVCRAACATDAIQLVPRQEDPKAANVWLKYG